MEGKRVRLTTKDGELIYGVISKFTKDKKGYFNNIGYCDIKLDSFDKILKNIPFIMVEVVEE